MEIAACILLRDVGNPADLFCRNPPERKFDPNHLDARLTLTIDTADETMASKFFLINFAVPEELNLVLKVNDVTCNDGVV